MEFLQNMMRQYVFKLLLLFLSFFSLLLVTPSWAQTPAVNPLTTAELPQSTLLAWAERAIISTFSYDYKNYKDVQKNAAGYFTAQAWKEYNRALVASGNLKAITAHKMRITAVPGAAKIVDQGVLAGHYNWKIEIPVKLIYQNIEDNNEVQEQNVVITLLVSKTPPNINPQGIAISSLVMQQK